MGISRIGNKIKQAHDLQVKYQAEEAAKYLNDLMEKSPQMAVHLASVPEESRTSITNAVVESAMNLKNLYITRLKSMGLRSASVQRITHLWYCAYINNSREAESALYEDIVDEVAAYVYQHQELYNTINTELDGK